MPVFPFSPFNYRFYPNYINRNRINREKGQGRLINNEKEKQINEEKEYNKNYNKKRTSKNNFANFNISAILNSDINTPILEILGMLLFFILILLLLS